MALPRSLFCTRHLSNEILVLSLQPRYESVRHSVLLFGTRVCSCPHLSAPRVLLSLMENATIRTLRPRAPATASPAVPAAATKTKPDVPPGSAQSHAECAPSHEVGHNRFSGKPCRLVIDMLQSPRGPRAYWIDAVKDLLREPVRRSFSCFNPFTNLPKA